MSALLGARYTALAGLPPSAPPRPKPAAEFLKLLHLGVFQLHRGSAAEDRYGDLEPALFLIHFLDQAVERGERPVGDAHLLADFEDHRPLRPLDAFLDLRQDARGFGLG